MHGYLKVYACGCLPASLIFITVLLRFRRLRLVSTAFGSSVVCRGQGLWIAGCDQQRLSLYGDDWRLSHLDLLPVVERFVIEDGPELGSKLHLSFRRTEGCQRAESAAVILE